MTQEELRKEIISVLAKWGVESAGEISDQILALFPKPDWEWEGELPDMDDIIQGDGIDDVIYQLGQMAGNSVHISITEIKEQSNAKDADG